MLDLDGADVWDIAPAAGVSRRGRPRPGPEHKQVRQRVAAQAVRAVHPTRDLARGEQTGNGRCAALGLDADTAHGVVGRRAHLHGAARDVDVGKLLELLVHRRQLASDVVRWEVADVEEDATVR